MKRESKRRVLIYPQYFLSNVPRRLGRRVSKKYSVTTLTKEELEIALKKLGFEYKIKEDVAYPRESNRSVFRLEVYTDERKQKLLKTLASIIKEDTH